MFSSSVCACQLDPRSSASSTYIGVTGVDHDTVERDALLSEAESELEVLRVGRVVEVY